MDTDVLIWHFRGFPKATKRLDQLPNLTLSAITWLELIQGFRSKEEMVAVQKSFEMRKAQRLPLTPTITERATTRMESLTLTRVTVRRRIDCFDGT